MSNLSPAAVDAIKMAIQLEKDGRAFFEEAAQKTENQLGKKMFEKLAKDEIDHLRTFQNIFDTVTEGGDWKELAQKTPRVGKVPVFEKKEGEEKRHVNPGELDALRKAMNIEKDAIEFFQKATNEADDPLEKKIFSTIQKEEEFHYDMLQAQYDSLSHSGMWYDIGEFQMDGMY
jgi:rubrerythrin